MKMLLITYNASIETELLRELDTLAIDGYTQWPRVLGVGRETGPRLDSNVWPGYNGALLAVVSEEKAAAALEMVARLKKTIARREGMEAFLLPVEKSTLAGEN